MAAIANRRTETGKAVSAKPGGEGVLGYGGVCGEWESFHQLAPSL